MCECNPCIVYGLTSSLLALAIYNIQQAGKSAQLYGRYQTGGQPAIYVPAKVGWFVMELPSFLVPMLLMYQVGSLDGMGSKILTFMFCGHYFHRTFIYAVRNNGCPTTLHIILSGCLFCTLNGYLQGYTMIYCTRYDDNWTTGFRFISGAVLYFVGISINIHSDCILQGLRKPGDIGYYIPEGGLFEYVTAANYFGEILEWFGYAIATSTLPAFAFAIFTATHLGPRACHHHRYYLEKFDDYPKSRKALIPLIF
ncbi:3-oxo-5-alpha-steroid 4-dehydrogenase 2-like [Scyliorhinus torazame]